MKEQLVRIQSQIHAHAGAGIEGRQLAPLVVGACVVPSAGQGSARLCPCFTGLSGALQGWRTSRVQVHLNFTLMHPSFLCPAPVSFQPQMPLAPQLAAEILLCQGIYTWSAVPLHQSTWHKWPIFQREGQGGPWEPSCKDHTPTTTLARLHPSIPFGGGWYPKMVDFLALRELCSQHPCP